jgi:hypothetical protein
MDLNLKKCAVAAWNVGAISAMAQRQDTTKRTSDITVHTESWPTIGQMRTRTKRQVAFYYNGHSNTIKKLD